MADGPQRLHDVAWATWRAVDVATLVFIVRDHELLLMRKKRGLGAGKINAPGGRREPGETLLACAIRETEEELCVTPHDPEQLGEVRFQFTDGYSIHGHVFRADGLTGTPTETAEGLPFWVPHDRIPYGEMWEDDRLWLPHLLAGRRFDGRFIFDGDRMLDHAVELLD
jgi:8-oxo-dGTP diphosphatase